MMQGTPDRAEMTLALMAEWFFTTQAASLVNIHTEEIPAAIRIP
jgi:hypothetical protein